ncbi:hypothetical protein HEQ62_10560 [Haematospirillum jordaniae]|uniref:Uncharacterized protein n=1 Tax=Haematospirillum jordaniae TaxID=1549855 RepID=A0A143DGM1_9PROT|nr:hypothetical protein [Haematospirillum jordaniae]AMW35855.1 hypothetical protein AY555_10820 [Haematospirillum jordaniae]NKD46026.1 hypothetical protein [Haematospirillum jordaniae]NKD58100.1 hypothetical protein [Haematospirillum jordaniae]NKD60209.1 hypothetical protein [Haematospirillum jordaniae]NKD68099.1 hypothetical protein [Haematospirillum jordaniae]
MAIARKPQKTEVGSDVDVDALINRGGSVAQVNQPASDVTLPAEKQVALRIPVNMLGGIDSRLKKRAVRIPRHTWILEAIAEKLEREEQDQIT